MNSIVSAGRIAILFAVALIFATPLCPPLLALDDHNPIGVTGAFEGVITTGCAYNVLNHNATRQIDDIVVPGAIGKYGLKMTRYYNSRRTSNSGPMGPGWTPDYFWSTSNGKTYYPNGNMWDSSCTGDWGLPGPLGVSDWPTTWNGHPAFRLADGGTVVFGDAVWGTVATQIIDPYGQTTTITLNSSTGQITRVTEPGGRNLQFFYTTIGGGQFLTEVDAYDGLGNRIDYVVYHYSSEPTGGTVVTTATCLTSVDYSDGQHASYTYTTDNAPEQPGPSCPCSLKLFPLVIGCDDVRYHGAMRRIAYGYQDGGPHGAILNEKYWDGVPGHEVNGPTVSSINPPAPSPILAGVTFPTTYTETRGDGPTRTFNYTSLSLGRPPNEDICPSWNGSAPAPQQFLLSYTDFQNHTTVLGYDSNWYVNSVQDARMNTTAYARASPPPTSIGQITKITHPDGTHIDYTYQPEPGAIGGHYVATVSDERQNITVYTRDPTTHLVTRIDYKNAVGTVLAYETFTYNSFGQVWTHRLKNGANESFIYNGRGLLTDKYNPKFDSVPGGTDPHTHYDYYTSADGKLGWIDRVKKVTLPANSNNFYATETYEYDRVLGVGGLTDPNGAAVAGRGLVTKMTHTDNTYQQFGYDAYGLKRQAWNELSQLTRYTYDDYNRLISVIDPLGKTTQYDYAPAQGNTTQAQQHTTSSVWWATSPSGIITENVHDANFRNTQTVEAYGTSQAATTWFNYDAVGNKTWVVDPRGTAGYTYPNGDVGYTTYTDYDNRNRKWQIREPLSRTTQFYYDDGINVTRIIRPDQTTETKVYDGMNRLTSDTVPKSTNPTVNIVTQFTYYPYIGDANGHSGSLLWQVIDGNNHYFTFQYDAFGSKTKLTYPGSVSSQSWAYDGAHNLMSRTTLNGEIQSFTYDNRNRRTGMSWIPAGDWAAYGYDLAGRLTNATNANSAVTRQYDAAGHLTLDQQNVTGLGIKSVSYPTYDADGRLTRMYVSGASGYDFTYSYDAMGRFEKIFLTNSSQLFQYYYDAASNEKERDNVVNGVIATYPADALNRMQSMDVRGSLPISHEDYTYSAMNRLTYITRGTLVDSFIYYLDGELKQATYQNNARIVNYVLDNAGNRTSVADNVNGNVTYTPNSVNQYTLVTGNSLSNGPEHEIQTLNGVTYTYINDEHLTQVSDVTNTYNLTYDALGRCVKRMLNGVTTYYIYDGEKPILEYGAGGTSAGVNVYGKRIDEILERVAVGSDNLWHTYFFDQDHEGSVLDLTDTSGNVLERYKYDAFGAPSIYTSTWVSRPNTIYDNHFLFTGREYAATYRGIYNVPTFNFYEYRARAYNPKLGRFMSEDPKLFDAGDYNLFRYCHNDPVDFTDPMGTDPPVAYSPRQMSRLIAEIREGQKQLAYLMALQHALGWPGHGAIQMGQVNYGIAQTAVQLRATYAQINQQKLSQLGSVFRPMASRFIGSANEMMNPEGYEVKIADQGGYRSFAEQASLRAISDAGGPHANKPGESAHNYGAAIDVDIIKGSRANEDIGRGTYNGLIGRLGALGESQGLIWGGHFTHPDPPHFQSAGIPVNGPHMLSLHQQLLRTTGAGLDALMGVP